VTEQSEADQAWPPSTAQGDPAFKVDTSSFAASDTDVAALIAEYPLAWVLPRRADAAQPHLLPLLGRIDATGRITALIGHMARRNPLVRAFEESPEALILFTGPQGYVSTGAVSNPHWAPTWNFAQLRVEANVYFEPERSGEALRALTEAMDAEEQTGWQPRDVGPRYEAMERAIIAFRAEVTRLEARFKLGQDESAESLREIIDRHPDRTLARWMQRANRDRL
jgi:transcriptional regulator